jgi:hypothetical protein
MDTVGTIKFNRNKESQAEFMKYTSLLHRHLVLQISFIIVEQQIPVALSQKSRLPHWFSSSITYYTRGKKYFYRYFKNTKSDYLYRKFSYYRKLVKATIKFDKL